MPPRDAPDHGLTALAAAASFAAPMAASILGAGASMGAYDAPELAAAAHGLGVTHPPGHPLWVACAAVATLLPLGTIPFRIALFGGLCVAVAGRLAFGVALGLSGAVLDRPELDAPWDRRMVPLTALAASLTATLGPAVMRQAVRVEVYALAGALAAATLALGGARSLPLAVRARASVLAVALGGANHHFIALTAAPVAIATVVERWREAAWPARRRMLAAWAALGALGLAPYGLLFARSNTAASLVRVRTAGDFVWTVTARAFQKNLGGGVPGTFGEHLLDVLDWVGASVTPLGLVMALAGLFFLLRAGAPRGSVLRLFGLAAGVCAARALLGFVAGNPDAAGYLLPGVVAVGCLTAGFTASAWRAIRTAPKAPEGPTAGARAVLVAVLVALPLAAPAYLGWSSVRDARPDRAYVPEDLTDAMLAPLPARAVALAYSPETAFRARYAQQVEGERPDVTVVPVSFLPYPGMNNTLLGRDPDLLPLVRDYLAHGEPRMEEVAALAALRPVRIEIDPHNVLAMVPHLVPRGLLAEVRGEPTTLAAVRATAAAHFAAMDALRAAMADEATGGRDAKSDELVLWRHYNDAVFFAARGARAEAEGAVRRGLELAPEAAELLGLRDALHAPGEGPVDVRPFVVSPAAAAPSSPPPP